MAPKFPKAAIFRGQKFLSFVIPSSSVLGERSVSSVWGRENWPINQKGRCCVCLCPCLYLFCSVVLVFLILLQCFDQVKCFFFKQLPGKLVKKREFFSFVSVLDVFCSSVSAECSVSSLYGLWENWSINKRNPGFVRS